MGRSRIRQAIAIDQLEIDAANAINGMAEEELIQFFFDCLEGRLDERHRPLIGMLAALGVYRYRGQDDSDDASPPCPHCGEDEIDQLVWIDDRRVRCHRCRMVFEPNS